MKSYFLQKNGEQVGPFTPDEVGKQNIQRTTPVWYEGLEDWTTAQNIEELKQFFPVTPPPFKAVTPPPFTAATPPPVAPAIPEYPPYPEEKRQNPAIKNILIIGASVLVLIAVIYLIASKMHEERGLPDSSSETSTSSVNSTSEPASSSVTQEAPATTQQAVSAAPPQPEPVTLQNREYRNNWKNYITLDEPEAKGVDYTLGGMTGVDVTVNNSTDYTIDEVVVEVYYIRKNGETWKTETVNVQNIHPGGAETATAPSSPNGVRAKAQIVSITCKRMHFCYDWYNESGGSDPYYCK